MKEFKIEIGSPLSIAEQIEVLDLANLDWLIERLKADERENTKRTTAE